MTLARNDSPSRLSVLTTVTQSLSNIYETARDVVAMARSRPGMPARGATPSVLGSPTKCTTKNTPVSGGLKKPDVKGKQKAAPKKATTAAASKAGASTRRTAGKAPARLSTATTAATPASSAKAKDHPAAVKKKAGPAKKTAAAAKRKTTAAAKATPKRADVAAAKSETAGPPTTRVASTSRTTPTVKKAKASSKTPTKAKTAGKGAVAKKSPAAKKTSATGAGVTKKAAAKKPSTKKATAKKAVTTAKAKATIAKDNGKTKADSGSSTSTQPNDSITNHTDSSSRSRKPNPHMLPPPRPKPRSSVSGRGSSSTSKPTSAPSSSPSHLQLLGPPPDDGKTLYAVGHPMNPYSDPNPFSRPPSSQPHSRSLGHIGGPFGGSFGPTTALNTAGPGSYSWAGENIPRYNDANPFAGSPSAFPGIELTRAKVEAEHATWLKGRDRWIEELDRVWDENLAGYDGGVGKGQGQGRGGRGRKGGIKRGGRESTAGAGIVKPGGRASTGAGSAKKAEHGTFYRLFNPGAARAQISPAAVERGRKEKERMWANLEESGRRTRKVNREAWEEEEGEEGEEEEERRWWESAITEIKGKGKGKAQGGEGVAYVGHEGAHGGPGESFPLVFRHVLWCSCFSFFFGVSFQCCDGTAMFQSGVLTMSPPSREFVFIPPCWVVERVGRPDRPGLVYGLVAIR